MTSPTAGPAPSDAIAFWDLTNASTGTSASSSSVGRGHGAGPPGPIRTRSDVPPPKDDAQPGDVPAMHLPRSAARVGASATAQR